MISLIIFLIILGLGYWLVTLIPLPDPFPVIIRVVFIILAILAVAQAFGFYTGFPVIR